MPELPEVETMRCCVAPAAGQRVRRVVRVRNGLQSILIEPNWPRFQRRLRGRTIVAVGRRGKRIVLELDGNAYLVLEPRMSGLVLLADPPDRKHLRLVVELEGPGPAQLLFWDQRGLAVAALISGDELQQRLGPGALGPDALEISAAEMREQFAGCRQPIKVALLDQRRLAGVGNLYASEILHRAHIHPATLCAALRPAEWRRLHAAMRAVLAAALRHQGSTLRDGTYRIARDTPGGYQAQHRVYQRHGEVCMQCRRTTIVRVVQAQRSTFFCPRCQRERKPR